MFSVSYAVSLNKAMVLKYLYVFVHCKKTTVVLAELAIGN